MLVAVKLSEDLIKLDGVRYYKSTTPVQLSSGLYSRYVSDDGDVIAVEWGTFFRRILRPTSGRKWRQVEATFSEV